YVQPLPSEHSMPKRKGASPFPTEISTRKVMLNLLGLAVLTVVVMGVWDMVVLLAKVDIGTWGHLLLASGATWLRTLIALAIGIAWTVPLGVAIGMSPRWSKRLQPIVQVVASVPATAFFPVLLPLLIALPGGLSMAAVILMLLGTQWYIL